MEIRKLELNFGQKIANPFKTTRKSTTNPFKYNDFDSTVFKGNTIDPLVCADVLAGINGKQNKLKMIASSVVGSMTKLKNSLTEPIVNFVNHVKETWNNTVINNEGLKNITDKLHTAGDKISGILNYDIGKGISDSISGIGKNITEKLPSIDSVTGIGKDLLAKWTDLVGKVHHKGIPSGLSVEEYRGLWIKENELIANSIKEAA